MPTRRSSTRKKPSFQFLSSLVSRVLKLNIIYLLGLLLIIASFLIGVLVTKVSYLEKGVTNTASLGANAGTGQTGAAPSQAPVGPVDVSVGNLQVLGDKNAKVTIVEFADFQCPFCEKFYTEAEKNIIKDYVDTGKAKFAFRHYAFLGQESTDSANGAECANEQGKFWEYHNYLYEHQGQENSGVFSKDNLKGFAAILGLDTAKFNNCLDTNKYQKNVDKDIADAGKAGVDGTPATFVNGVRLSGALPYSDFKKEIENALASR